MQNKRLEALQQGQPVQLADVVLRQVNCVKLVLRAVMPRRSKANSHQRGAKVLDGGNLVPCSGESIPGATGAAEELAEMAVQLRRGASAGTYRGGQFLCP